MEENLRNAIEYLKDDLDERTPHTLYTESANRSLVQEFVELNREKVKEAISESTEEDGTLNPFGLSKRLLSDLLEHCGDRVSSPTI